MNNGLGNWIRDARTSQHLDMRELAERSGLSIATLSRLENGQGQPTIQTIVALVRGLRVDVRKFFEIVGRRYMGGDNELDNDGTPTWALTIYDVQHFLRYFYRDVDQGSQLLAAMLNHVSALYSAAPRGAENQDPIPTFNKADIDRFFIQPLAFMDYHLKFPVVDAPLVEELYQAHGLITHGDVGAYLRSMRRRMNKGSLAHLEVQGRRSDSVMSRIETGLLENLKWQDALDLDAELSNPPGQVLSMFWDAARINAEIIEFTYSMAHDVPGELLRRYEAGDVLKVFVTLCRWLHVLSRGHEAWLNEIRATVGALEGFSEEESV